MDKNLNNILYDIFNIKYSQQYLPSVIDIIHSIVEVVRYSDCQPDILLKN